MVFAHHPAHALLGEILVRGGVARDAIERALAKQGEDGGLIGEVLVPLKLITEDQLAVALAVQAGLEYREQLPRAEDIPEGSIDKLPISFARPRLPRLILPAPPG